MLRSGLNMLRSNDQAVSVMMMNLLAAPGPHAYFWFDLGHGKGKKSR